LCDQKWRLGLGQSLCLQDGTLLESLHNQDEDIEIESYHGGYNLDPRQGAGEMNDVTCADRNRHEQRDDADRNCRRELMEAGEESRHARRHRAHQIEFHIVSIHSRF
jgi:hypothetical protein